MGEVEMGSVAVESSNIKSDSNPPPAYLGASTGEDPPSYDSLYGKLKAAQQTSDGHADFAKAACFICCASFIPMLLVLAYCGVAIACLIMGTIHLNDCPVEKMVPVYMLVFGVIFVVKSCLTTAKYAATKNNKEGDEESKAWQLERLLDCFLTIWFIVGNVFVYRTRSKYQSTDPTADDYCHRETYLFAFWVITVTYIMLALCLVLCCCCLFCMCCACCVMGKKMEKEVKKAEAEAQVEHGHAQP